MANSRRTLKASLEETAVWSLMMRDRLLDAGEVAGLGIQTTSDRRTRERYQIFELAVARLFASLRRDFEWFVTPNGPDHGSTSSDAAISSGRRSWVSMRQSSLAANARNAARRENSWAS